MNQLIYSLLIEYILYLIKISANIIQLQHTSMQPNQPNQPNQQQQKQQQQQQQHQTQPAQAQPQPVSAPASALPAAESSSNNNAEDWQSMGSQQDLQQIIENAVEQIQSHQQPQQQAEAEQDEQCEWQQQSSQKEQEEHSLGCEHYLRNCSVQAPCCHIFYTCKLCHDQKYAGPKSQSCKVQRMAFSDVKQIKCLKCNKIQQPSIKCINPECEITFGKYACLKCKLYENRSTKVDDIFHCDDCQMCRRGKKEKFFHCQVCGYCRHISEKGKHKCTQNVAQSKCPVCMQVLKYSTKHYQALPCGHLIHLQCLSMYNQINCPVCGMAIHKQSSSFNAHMDAILEQTRPNLPKEVLDKKVDILCNQCLHKSYQQSFHFLGIKCQNCGTYNTKMI